MNEFQYFLKREYGHPMTFIHVMDSIVDVDTGGQVQTEIQYSIASAIFLPVETDRKVIAAARSNAFPYGDNFDLSSSIILIDKDDLPLDFMLNNNDKVQVLNSDGTLLREYKIVTCTDLHHHEIHCVQVTVEELQQTERVPI